VICVKELATEENIFENLQENLKFWFENYGEELKKLNVNFTKS